MMDNRNSLSVTYYDPEAEPMPESLPAPETPPRPGEPSMDLLEGDPPKKKRGRPTGSKNRKKKHKINWFTVWRAVFWVVIAIISVTSLYRGIQGWLGQSAAYLALALSVLIAAFLLDRDWKRMRKK